MKVLEKREIKLLSLVMIVFLISVHMFVAFMLNYYHYSDQTYSGSRSIVHFHPEINEAGSFLNLKFGITYSVPVFILITVLGVFAGRLFLAYVLFLREVYSTVICVIISPVFFISGCMGRFLERLIWGYTFDFIAVRNIGILDVCDLYLSIGCIALVITAIYFQVCENNQTRKMNRSERRRFLKEINKKFWEDFCKCQPLFKKDADYASIEEGDAK